MASPRLRLMDDVFEQGDVVRERLAAGWRQGNGGARPSVGARPQGANDLEMFGGGVGLHEKNFVTQSTNKQACMTKEVNSLPIGDPIKVVSCERNA